MGMSWDDFKGALEGERLPAAVVDLEALERNVDQLTGALEGSACTLRVASKSVRHVGLLRRILERGGARFTGLMCFTVEEAVFLGERGFDDLLVAYPTLQPAALRALSAAAAEGLRAHIVVDSVPHLQALRRACDEGGGAIGVILELDVAYRKAGGRLHIGARRSPLRTADDVLAIARAARVMELEVRGLMAYEAHIAGLPDANPFTTLMNPVARVVKAVATPFARELRAEVVERMRAEGFAPAIVNGGGTGSLHLTTREEAITEVTAGSGFLCPHLFDYFRALSLEPAAFFACEVVRRSDPGFLTCLGGGYVASGAPGEDRLPLPWLPKGLSYVGAEGAGEVQTPLEAGEETAFVDPGDPVIFRHAKAGELAERFNTYLMLRGGAVEAREPTYRGEGACFL